MTASGARIGWLGEFQLRGQDLWLIPRCVLEGETFSAVKPMRMEIGPGREIFQHGQSLYVEDLPLRYPQATQLLALNAKAYIGIPLQGQGGVPWVRSPCCSTGRWPTPFPCSMPSTSSVSVPPSNCSASPTTMPCAWPRWPSTPTTVCW